MEDTTTPKKLMLIAVDVDSGKIREPVIPDPFDPTDPAKYGVDPKPRVVGIVNEATFDNFIEELLRDPAKAERVRRPVNPQEPYQGPNPPTHVATILHVHHSPGCTTVIINGWPVCYP